MCIEKTEVRKPTGIRVVSSIPSCVTAQDAGVESAAKSIRSWVDEMNSHLAKHNDLGGVRLDIQYIYHDKGVDEWMIEAFNEWSKHSPQTALEWLKDYVNNFGLEVCGICAEGSIVPSEYLVAKELMSGQSDVELGPMCMECYVAAVKEAKQDELAKDADADMGSK